MKPFRRRSLGETKGRKVCVFPLIRFLVARDTKRPTIHETLSQAWPVSPRVNMMGRNRATGNPAILACVTGAILDGLLPLDGGVSDALWAGAVLPMRIGRRVNSPVIVSALSGTVLTGAAPDAIGGHPEAGVAVTADTIDLRAYADVFTWDRAEPLRGITLDGEAPAASVTSAAINERRSKAIAHAPMGAKLSPAFGASLAAHDAIGFWQPSHRDTTATGGAVSAPLPDIGRPAYRTTVGVFHTPIIPQTL